MYVCHTKNGKTLRNVEYLRLTDDKVEAIECYFGAIQFSICSERQAELTPWYPTASTQNWH